MKSRSNLPVRLALASVGTILVVTALIAQTPNQCPTPLSVSHQGWPQGFTVYYDDSPLPPSVRTQIERALSRWTAANGTNHSGVTFAPADATHPPTLNIQAGVASKDGRNYPAITNSTPGANGVLTSATITIDMQNLGGTWFDQSATNFSSAMLKIGMHEIGHTMGLGDQQTSSGNCGGETLGFSVMNQMCGINDQGGAISTNVTTCDQQGVMQEPVYSSPPPPSCSDPDRDGDGYTSCNGDCEPDNPDINPGVIVRDYYYFGCPISPPANTDVNCNGVDDYWECNPSPIIIDLTGDGFNLTDAANGVNFDLYPDGNRERLSWSGVGSDDAWLVLDRNGNGTIDNGSELFGNFTPQSRSYGVAPNGFIALAEYDKPLSGGNGDGQIDSRDTIFSSLRLWQDTNHNGISESGELHTLGELGIAVLELEYRQSRRNDQYGNRFRYRAKVKDIRGEQLGRWAWDVFLVGQ